MHYSREDIEDIYFLTPMQEGMLFHSIKNASDNIYNNQLILYIKGTIDYKVLNDSFNELISRHQIFRSAFFYKKIQRPIQVILKEKKINIDYEDFTTVTEETKRKFKKHKTTTQSYDLSSNTFNVSLIRLEKEEYQLIWNHHHILMDGWSIGNALKELFTIYDKKVGFNQDISLSKVPPYKVFINWLNSQNYDEAKTFWSKYMEGVDRSAEFPKKALVTTEIERKDESETIKLSSKLTDNLIKLGIENQTTLNNIIQVAWGILLQRYNNTNDVVFGSVVSGRQANIEHINNMIGLFINTVPVRISSDKDTSIKELIQSTQEKSLYAKNHEFYPLYEIQSNLKLNHPLINHILLFENYPDVKDKQNFGVGSNTKFSIYNYEINEKTNYDLNVYVIPGEQLSFYVQYNSNIYGASMIRQIFSHFETILNKMSSNINQRVEELEIQPINTTLTKPFDDDLKVNNIVKEIELIAQKKPNEIAYICGSNSITYKDLVYKSNVVANNLVTQGIDKKVCALIMDRSINMVIGMIGILKAGATYLPIEPSFPIKRINYMLEKAEAECILSDNSIDFSEIYLNSFVFDIDNLLDNTHYDPKNIPINIADEDIAYIIFTSGSTGKPKGVKVSHKNLRNFIQGMDEKITVSDGAFLAITSISFDISILELLWTVSKGIQVRIQSTMEQKSLNYNKYLTESSAEEMDFSLFFFSNYDESSDNKYKMLKDASMYADRNGFKAVWTPERHFHEFGGLFANPAVTSSALATITQSINIRAGSVVSPLHDTIRIAEEWSMVDNLSGGRVGVSFASGWHENDFALAPENYKNRKDILSDQIEELRQLWQGNSIERKNGENNYVKLKTYPKPIQKKLPLWITTSGNSESFVKAGQMGVNILTHMLGQDLENLKENISLYRKALEENGFSPNDGKVSLMLHTFIGEDLKVVESKVKEPFCNYLKSNFSLLKGIEKDLGDNSTLEQIVETGFERYWQSAAILGTKETAKHMIDNLKSIGVNEIACLIDFGCAYEDVMDSLEKINEFKNEFKNENNTKSMHISQAKPIKMMQSTPSRLKVLVDDYSSNQLLDSLNTLIVGGESFPDALVKQLQTYSISNIYNMYGPTETTIWSTVKNVSKRGGNVDVGSPILNTRVLVLDEKLRLAPKGVIGEVYISGLGVAQGYINEIEKTEVNFIKDPYHQNIIYRTGDLGYYLSDGSLQVIGRKDNQVKIRGHRIELEEIENVLFQSNKVENAVVIAENDSLDNKVLVSYIKWKDKEQLLEIKELLKRYLPEYMVPSKFIQVDTIPLNNNGKVDKSKLLKLVEDSTTTIKTQSPKSNNQYEKILLNIWTNILNKNDISLDDSFFDIGGHSLLAVKLEVEIEKKGLKATELAVFKHNSIRELASHIKDLNKT